ncbi:beta-lactamase family protein [Streptomonospora sp. S1-112]|uniref:Beta-lactamase family protein n=1 Tax=Streptomonospora mangrovi TaxID=2883123 RepID=A0A9X3NM92_9ACTN|nr:serine hydrolase domain-containing protein [Streptomonospora mangrovi]MDA0565585.1 beta-lactamase family protein [Streptomonospora mangrovi]
MTTALGRRDLLKTTGAAGAAVLAGGLLSTATAAPAAAAERTWRATGVATASMASFDTTMKSYMQARGITAGSLAVARNGKLLHVRGYTWDDPAVPTTQPTDVFRLASVSKPITATAVMRLVQTGKLSLTARVADLLTLRPPAGQSADPRLGQVTVRQLLQHLGGWDRDASFDPLWSDARIASGLGVGYPLSSQDIMRYTTGQPLDHAPGTTYAYSNYGYLLAGEIIAAVSGTTYEDYVKREVLGPLRISRMRLGASLAKDTSGEVDYTSKYTGRSVVDDSGATVPLPYGGFNMETQFANGGWVGSAADVVRFCYLYDQPAEAGVLTAASIKSVYAKPEAGGWNGYHYGLGWYVRPVSGGQNTWHFGGMPGTYTLVMRSGGLSIAALFNQRKEGDDLDWGEIDPLLWDAADAVGTWPTADQTARYFPPEGWVPVRP